jgi:hypothetical protein
LGGRDHAFGTIALMYRDANHRNSRLDARLLSRDINFNFVVVFGATSDHPAHRVDRAGINTLATTNVEPSPTDSMARRWRIPSRDRLLHHHRVLQSNQSRLFTRSMTPVLQSQALYLDNAVKSPRRSSAR